MMTDDFALLRDAEAGDRAGRELAETAAAFDGLRAQYIQAWQDTPARDTDARERLWQAVQVLGKVQQHLRRAVDGGKLARAELNDLKGKTGLSRFL